MVGKKLTLKKDTNYSYDANGNLIQQNDSQSITNYVYDFENRLKSVASPTLNESYAYNAEGKRISQIEGGVVTKFLYDGMNTILERNANNQTIASYARGLNYAGGIGGIISSYNASGVSSHYLYDGLGSVTGLTDSTGSTIKTYTYDAFGNILQQSGTATNAYQFQTKYASSTTGLVYFGFRHYNPQLGRFITKDPLGMVDGPNMYGYLNNNPVNLIDPWGLCGKKPWWQKLEEGYYYGTGFGTEAAEWYAQQQINTGNLFWAIPGTITSLWIPETYQATSSILIGGYLTSSSLFLLQL